MWIVMKLCTEITLELRSEALEQARFDDSLVMEIFEKAKQAK